MLLPFQLMEIIFRTFPEKGSATPRLSQTAAKAAVSHWKVSFLLRLLHTQRLLGNREAQCSLQLVDVICLWVGSPPPPSLQPHQILLHRFKNTPPRGGPPKEATGLRGPSAELWPRELGGARVWSGAGSSLSSPPGPTVRAECSLYTLP